MKTLRIIRLALVAVVLSATLVACSDDDDDGGSSSGKIKGHSYVDLGLSVKWATCNVGASSPEDYGDYFALGEITPKTSYTSDNYEFDGKPSSISGDPSCDAARANWGGTWRMPLVSEVNELIENCDWVWTMRGDHRGCLVTGPNGNSIFLPATGYYSGETCYGRGSYGYYGLSSSRILWIDSDPPILDNTYNWEGRSIRPVSE